MLTERRVDFGYDFWMRCEDCGASSRLTAQQYADSSDSMMTCTGCGQEFNFGPAVIDLRDAGDRALDDGHLSRIAWYHTTTDLGWPLPSKPLSSDDVKALGRWNWPKERLEAYRERHENRALYLGTYEAAIESMLRRMRDQGDRDSQFYLHRVRLHDDLRIEPGWRDENHAEAAAITSIDLEAHGVDVVRYLNAHEAVGSLSIAVVRGAIASVQAIVIPVPHLVDQTHHTSVQQARALRDEVREIQHRHADDVLTGLDRIRKEYATRTGAPFVRTPEPQSWAALTALEQLAAETYLPDFPPVIKQEFLRSVGSPEITYTHEDDLRWLTRFGGLAALLTRHERVRRALAGQPWREV